MRATKLIALVAVVGLLGLMPGAHAKDTDIIKSGSCSGRSTWKLKLSPENGRIEADFEVDQNRNGVTWNARLKKNGNVFWSGQRVTQAPSGSWEVVKRTSNGAGDEVIVGKATNPRSGEVCRGTATATF